MTILASMLWRRIGIPGHDACRLEEDQNGRRLIGTAVFRQPSGQVNLSYTVECDLNWKTLSGHVCGIAGDRHINYLISHQGMNWTLNGDVVPGLENLVDLDLSFTPATNFLQLQRVPIPRNETIPIPVAWLDFDTGSLKELRQTYKRVGEKQVWYEAPAVGYKGLLILKPNGFIQRYPQLWEAEEEV